MSQIKGSRRVINKIINNNTRSLFCDAESVTFRIDANTVHLRNRLKWCDPLTDSQKLDNAHGLKSKHKLKPNKEQI